MNGELKAARVRGVPLISILTTDEPATMAGIMQRLNDDKTPLLQYDCVRGLAPLNDAGKIALNDILGDNDPALLSDPTTAISAATERAPNSTVICCLGAQRYLDDSKTQQAIANARDPFKQTKRTLIFLSAPGVILPADLAQDIYQISDEAPDAEARGKIINDLHNAANLPAPDADTLKTAVNATRGLSPYACEQATALSLSKSGLNLPQLWQRWRQAINATPGLSVDTSGATLDDIGGLQSIKDFAKRLMAGREAPAAIIRIEEIEKAMSGSGYGNGGLGDSSGTSQGMLGAILTHMQDENQTGIIAVGPPGSGKSLCSTAIGSAGNVPTITLDLGALKGGLVGETEGKTRRALATIKALAGKGALWVATCNGVASLPPELRRRFQYGLWFFDLPDAEERAQIWKIWISKYPDVADIRPDDTGWTGAEIRTAVQIAYRLNCTPRDAAAWVVPVSKMAAETIETLRRQATGRYLSASRPGTYSYQPQAAAPQATGRRIELDK